MNVFVTSSEGLFWYGWLVKHCLPCLPPSHWHALIICLLQRLPTCGDKSTTTATSPDNKLKNRFANICVCELFNLFSLFFSILNKNFKFPPNLYPDDDNRVVLRPLAQYDSDYVNASYVDVSLSPVECQL